MKHEKKLKEYETVWTCDFCGKEFKTKKESDKHELVCDKNPDSIIFPLNKNIKKSWLVLWITTMVVFGITVFINSNLFSQGLNLFDKKWFLNLFFVNIIFGIIAFLGMVFTENKNKKKIIPIVKYSFVICLFYCLFNVGAVLSVKNTFQEQKQKSDYLKYQPQTNLTPTTTPKTVIQPTKKPIDTDPIIDCKFDAGQCKGASIKVRNSQCLNTTCCQIGNNWIPYITVQKCKEAQNTYTNNNQIIAPTYKPNNPSYTSGEVKISCSYHSGDYNFDYGMLTYDECKIKSDAYWNSKKASLYTPTPSYNVPTVAPTPNISNLCNQAVSDWNSYVTEFYATQYNNYSSSAEAIRALENERQEFQNLLNSYGCNITLRLM